MAQDQSAGWKTALKRALRFPVTEVASRWPAPWLLRKVRSFSQIQLTQEQLIYIAQHVAARRPTRLLVFGLGNDSSFWAKLNRGGETVFLEDNPEWSAEMKRRAPSLRVHMVGYGTRLSQWRELLAHPEELQMTLPDEVRQTSWSVILVDAPAGFVEPQPGRMKSIFLSTQLAEQGADIFVHDCEREVECAYCDRFLGPARLRKQIDHLRHYGWDESKGEEA